MHLSGLQNTVQNNLILFLQYRLLDYPVTQPLILRSRFFLEKLTVAQNFKIFLQFSFQLKKYCLVHQ